MAKTSREILYQINGALLDILSMQELVEAGNIKTSVGADRIFRLCGSLERRADLIRKKVLNELELKYGGKR